MGDGRMLKFLDSKGIKVDGIDLLYDSKQNFFNWQGFVDLIITNPPYTKAQSFIEYAKPRCNTLILLLRINFLASMKRHSFWDDHKPDTLFVLSKRPSFDGNGTDMTEYAWFVWQNDTKHIEQGIHHIKP